MQRIIYSFKVLDKTFKINYRNFSFSGIKMLNKKWRVANGLPINPNAFGPLTNLPDYSFVDGRPTPLGANQRRRMIRQEELTEKIVKMSKELDFAKERYNRMQREKKDEEQRILDSRLKPKGHLLPKDKLL